MICCARFLLCAGISTLATCLMAGTDTNTFPITVPEFSETVERPLFAKSRRAYVPPVVAVEKPSVEPEVKPVLVAAKSMAEPDVSLQPSDLVLNGVVRRGTRMIALVEQRATGKPARLELGAAQVMSGTGKMVDIEITHITEDSLTLFAGAPLVFKLRTAVSRDEIDVERVDPTTAQWAMLRDPSNVPEKIARGEPPAYLIPTGVIQNTGFMVGGDNKK